jgi:hypothetical protein
MEIWEQPIDVRIASAQSNVQLKIAQLSMHNRAKQDGQTRH